MREVGSVEFVVMLEVGLRDEVCGDRTIFEAAGFAVVAPVIAETVSSKRNRRRRELIPELIVASPLWDA